MLQLFVSSQFLEDKILVNMAMAFIRNLAGKIQCVHLEMRELEPERKAWACPGGTCVSS